MSGRFKAQGHVRARLAQRLGEALGIFDGHDRIVRTG